MKFLVAACVFIISVNSLALEVTGAEKSQPLHPKIEILCAKKENVNKHDHGVFEAQFAALGINNGNVELTFNFSKKFCQQNAVGVVDFVSADLFASYSYSFMQDILVEPLQFAVTLYNTNTYVEYSAVTLKADSPVYQLNGVIPLTDILSASEISSIKNDGKKIEKFIGISVNQLSDYTTASDGKTIKANQFFHLKTSLVFF